ncbi:RHS repeat-associated core domain-containing protein [Nonomuraea typhae]|uniref:RHS repeat-associated core domain-containing protein n=1 Tax=Nonomuraea typhae TaxID=2603600 RepID=A0ABW7Z6V9_9ACTN
MDGQASEHVYGADGQRLIRREGGVSTLYLGSMELSDSGGTVKAKRYYTTAGGAMVATRAHDGSLTWLLSDGQNSPQLAVADATSAVSRQRYLPYGGLRGRDEFPFTDLGFLGKTRDASSGLNLLGARFYDPGLGRFISPDPVLDLRTPRLANPYGYAGNNPVGLSDPSGLKPDNCEPGSKSFNECMTNERYDACVRKMGKDNCDRRELEAQVQRELDALFDALRGIAKIAADELGITAGIDCFTKGDLGACGETALNVLASLAGGLLGKLVAKYGLPTKWAKLADLAKSLFRLGERALDKFKSWSRAKGDLKALEDKLATAARNCSSFVPGTLVVMADGTGKPIEEVRPGDEVLATDPGTGQTTAQPVLAVHADTGAKTLIQLTVDADGPAGDRTGVILATDSHPFWLPDLGAWQPAARLQPGQWLRTGSGSRVQITTVTTRTTGSQSVHNLTVAGPHTYYVRAGVADALVHNAGPKTCTKPVNLAGWRTVKINMKHILSGHKEGGSRIREGSKKDLFDPSMTDEQIEWAIRRAYRNAEIIGRNTDGNQIKLRGVYKGREIIMWYDRTTKTITSAWPGKVL